MWKRIQNRFKGGNNKKEQGEKQELRPKKRGINHSPLETKVAYKYPKHTPFRFPVIPDDKNQETLEEPTYLRRHQSKHSQTKRPQPKKQTTPFRPSHVPSPIYGYQNRKVQRDIENLPTFVRNKRDGIGEHENYNNHEDEYLEEQKEYQQGRESNSNVQSTSIHKESLTNEQVKKMPNKEHISNNTRQNNQPTLNRSANAIQITTKSEQVGLLERSDIKLEKKEQNTHDPEQSIPLHLLNDPVVQDSEDERWVFEQRKLLEETLKHFNVQAKVVHATQGPTVTRFEVQPELGVKVSRVRNLSDDIKMNMSAKDIRIEAPIPGKNTIGIEVPNLNAQVVGLQEIFEMESFKQNTSPLTIGLGLSIEGIPHITTIDKMPHGLIAGATGSGKSVCINTILISLLYKASPKDVKLLLIDPKMVELAPYNDIPHLVSPVITDVKAATAALKWAVEEMEQRYERFVTAGVRDIHRYNEKAMERGEENMPNIVIVIDELADLMMASPQDVEDAICRIAQKARACGMHLLLATQRPSVDVITGLIKANIQTRIAFSVSSQVDSRTIIDTNGAEKLLGKGDMLFIENGSSQSIRLQGAFVADDEIERVTEYIKLTAKPDYLFQEEQLIQKVESDEEIDELFEDIIQFILEENRVSTSLLQRKFRIGYNRAARLIDTLEDRGMISEQNGSKPRDVLFTLDQLDDFI